MVEAILSEESIPRIFIMTSCTGTGYFAFMRIIMAIHTGSKRDVCKFLKLSPISARDCMTFFTVYLCMLSSQREVRIVVIESGGRAKSFKIMATNAIAGESILVVVIMAGKAGIVQAQKASLTSPDLTISNKICFVAFPTFDYVMLTFQFVACEIVVEIILIKAHHVKTTTMMFTVAIKTILPSHTGICMIPTVLIEQRLNIIMTIQALLIVYLLTQVVAFGAISNALQFGMSGSQISRRDLRLAEGQGKQANADDM